MYAAKQTEKSFRCADSAPGTYRGSESGMASRNGTRPARPAQKKKTASSAKKTAPAHARKKTRAKPDINEKWSILIFGIGILLCALIAVPGASVWSWVRVNILFGVFGIGSYVLVPILLYVAVLVAVGRPVKGKILKGIFLLMIVCGTFLVFSKTDLTDMTFLEGMAELRDTGATHWGIGGGMLGAVFGWTLLLLCGRPAANIIIIIFMIVSVMLFTGVTPADIWYFCSGHVGRMRDSASQRADERAQKREEMRLLQQQQQFEQDAQSDIPPFDLDAQAYEAAHARRRNSIDIDIGHDPINPTQLTETERPVIGPGGTFGMFPGREAEHAPEPVQVPAQSEAAPEEAQPDEVQLPGRQEYIQSIADDALANLIRKAAGPAPETQPEEPESAETDTACEPERHSEGYSYPPLSLFQKQPAADEQGIEEEMRHNADLLVKTLSSFGVNTHLMDISRGPSVTRYELQPSAGVKISRITNLSDDIALNLATTGVRIEAPIPGKAAVGIEVPNRHSTAVSIRSILESPAFTKNRSALTLALGKDIAGACQVADLTKMPHLLIAGSTGSGKSVCINTIIMSFLYKFSPEELKFIMIDPKVVELAEYNGIPHLLMPVVTEPRKAAGALGAAVAEMERRYHLFAETNVREIKSYNRMAEETEGVEKLPYIAIIIDELADLMMVAGKDVEDYICRIAQKARAAGMHLIVATQRPSVDVITGLIKANIPSRIAFAVSSQIDSRTILDAGGAEKLLGMGDMLFLPVAANKPLRIQGAYVRDEEITAVLDYIKKHSSADYDEEMIRQMDKCAAAEKNEDTDSGDDHDPMLKTAVEVVIDAGQASTSLLQRRCKLGYARAARIIDEMEQMHLIGPYEGSKPRQVLITRQQWIEMTMQQDETEASEE